MPDRVRIDSVAALAPGDGRTYALGDRKVAVFNVAGTLFAMDDLCPHQGGSLGTGSVVGGHAICPLHGWRFDVATGECAGRPGARVRTHAVFAAGDDLFVELSDEPGGEPEEAADGIHRYLVRYGALGWVGRFGSIERIECGVGDRVAVATSRGIEAGVVLAFSNEGAPPAGELAGKPAGEVLRVLAAGELRPDEPRELFEAARTRACERGQPLEFVDCERLLDGETVVLYYVGEADSSLDEFRVELAREYATAIRCEPLFDPPPTTGCGKEGCGGGGCGA